MSCLRAALGPRAALCLTPPPRSSAWGVAFLDFRIPGGWRLWARACAGLNTYPPTWELLRKAVHRPPPAPAQGWKKGSSGCFWEHRGTLSPPGQSRKVGDGGGLRRTQGESSSGCCSEVSMSLFWERKLEKLVAGILEGAKEGYILEAVRNTLGIF